MTNNLKYFNEFINESKSFNDYPKSAQKAARKALKWKEKYGDEVKGGTRVGWTRANQLANGENLSVDTIKRMKAFFDRHQKNKKIEPENKGEPWKDNGYVAWLIWGGDSAYNWAERKIKEIEKENKNENKLLHFNNFLLEYNNEYKSEYNNEHDILEKYQSFY